MLYRLPRVFIPRCVQLERENACYDALSCYVHLSILARGAAMIENDRRILIAENEFSQRGNEIVVLSIYLPDE
jgi:hypothetical protein